jgi:hypothetical protein
MVRGLQLVIGRATLIDTSHAVVDGMVIVLIRVYEPSAPSGFRSGEINGQVVLRVRRPDR